jgi:hypothetical protein
MLGNATAAAAGNLTGAAAEAAAPETLDLDSILNAAAAAGDPANGGGSGGGSHKWQAGLLSVLISAAVILAIVTGE